MTLIELLVVIAIMAMLAAYALPKLEPMARERKIREAARSINVFLDRARSRAIETGRPCGVAFERFTDNLDDLTDIEKINDPRSNASVMLYQAEVPPPYAGNTSGAAMMLQVQSSTLPCTVLLKAQVQFNSLSNGLVKRGDLVQFNGQGPWYEIYDDLSDDYDFPAGEFINFDATLGQTNGWINTLRLSLRWVGSPGCVSPWPTGGNWSAPVSFQILRRPQRTMAQPLSLPAGTAVDLSASGTDNDQGGKLFASGQGDVTIMFSPNGSIKNYYYRDVGGPYQEINATDPIYLLVGWREQIGEGRQPPKPGIPEKLIAPNAAVDEEELPNRYVLSNLWIALSPQTGLITVAENAYPQGAFNDVSGGAAWEAVKGKALIESRSFARQAQSKGGR